MGEVIWAPEAINDIDSIAEYIGKDSDANASLLVSRILEMTFQLHSYPFSGRIIPEINSPDCRELIYDSYRIMYRIVHESVWITGVVHGTRNWKPE